MTQENNLDLPRHEYRTCSCYHQVRNIQSLLLFTLSKAPRPWVVRACRSVAT